MKKRNGTKIWVIGIMVLTLIGIATVALSGDDLMRREISFTHNGNVLSGTLVLPKGTDSAPVGCVVFVHGSGDMPRDAYGYYEPYWQKFAQRGWCSLSWDKPGVGKSQGEWKNQSMQERALEVSAAIEFLRQQPGLKRTPVGLIGFSQAGWVMPKTARMRNDVEFIISVSGAIDWMEQSRYSGDIRLKAEGYSPEEISKIHAFDARVNMAIRSGASYQAFLLLMSDAPEGADTPMSEAYWNFVAKNWRSNVRQDLRNLAVPVLAIYGSRDAYVDPVSSARIYREELERSPAPFFEVMTFENAGHSLMLTDRVAPEPKGLGMWLLLLKIWVGGESNFPPGYFASLQDWLDRFSARPQPM